MGIWLSLIVALLPIFLMTDVLCIFHMLICHPVYYLAKYILIVCSFLFELFVFLLMSSESSLYIPKKSSFFLIRYVFCIDFLFSQFVAYLLISLTVSFKEQEF